MRFDIDKLRPWEWANWESDEADLYMTLTSEFRSTISHEREAARKAAERLAALKPKGAGRG